MRAQFLGMVSHELRTPLIAIKGSTATVLGSPAVLRPAEMLQFFRVIDHQADHMRSLIGDPCWTRGASRRARCQSLPCRWR